MKLSSHQILDSKPDLSLELKHEVVVLQMQLKSQVSQEEVAQKGNLHLNWY